MSQKDKVMAYYQAANCDYERFWFSRESLAMHFGYYDATVRSHNASLLKLTSSRFPKLQGMGFHPSRGGFPASSRRAFPGSMQVWSYRFSTGEDREPLGLGITGGVDIPVMHRPTLWTGPLTDC